MTPLQAVGLVTSQPLRCASAVLRRAIPAGRPPLCCTPANKSGQSNLPRQQQIAGDVDADGVNARMAHRCFCIGPQHAAQRMPGEMRLHEIFIGDIRRLVVVHDLFQTFLHIEVIRTQRRANDIGR